MDDFGDMSKIVLLGRRNTFATFSEHALHFSWQVQHFRGVVLRAFANRIGRAAGSGDKVQNPSQAWYFVRRDEIWRSPRTIHRF